MGTLQSFKARIEAFLVQNRMSPTRFGELAANDPNFVFRLRRKTRPRYPRADTIDRIDRWMRDYRVSEDGAPALDASRKCA
jgi:hypothetical protein